MSLKIGQDQQRFKKIIKGKIRKNLKKYISRGELIGRVGKDKVSIPIPHINLPKFKFNDQDAGGVGQGDGDIGDPIGPGQDQPGQGKAGQGEGDHAIEVEVTIEELAQILAEELELPNIEPKGEKNIEIVRSKYTGIQKSGPEGLRHIKRTFKENLKRQIATGNYTPGDPVVPQRPDRRYKAPKVIPKPVAKAVIIYMMDVSGSMGDDQKEIVRTESFWIDTWISSQYQGVEKRYIIHDAVAKEVDEKTFYTTRESGGTLISSAYNLCIDIIEKDYPTSEWNIYPFHFSDGDNWSGDDNEICMDLIKKYMIPWTNQFSYGQVESMYGSGGFINELKEHFENEPKVVLSEIENKEDIMDSIKDFLGKGN
jgi:sporulation protein YhbH